MESTLVIKVNYGKTLRRFNARILPENDKLDLDMDGLRAKICSLFNFPPDTDLKMTYIDEDGDAVTLVDDDDLFDVIRQRLKFLRIDVLLVDEKSIKTSDPSTGNSTPLRSPRTENRFANINAGVAEILKPLPEPVQEAFSKLYSDISSKVALSNPMVADLVESVAQLSNSYRNSDSQPPTGGESSTQNVACESPMPPSVTNSKPSKNDDYPIASSKSKLVEVPSKNIQEVNAGNLIESVGNNAKVMFSPIPVDLNVLPTDSNKWECAISNPEPSASNTTPGMKKETNEEKDKETAPCFFGGMSGNDAVFTRMSDTEQEYLDECPYSGVPVTGGFPFQPISHGYMHPAKRSFSRCADLGTVFHKGVICDGCGVHPITGPRFKSKVKEDFDLCSMCFAKMGNEADYVRMDHPISYRHSRSLRGLHHQRWVGPPIVPRILKGCGAKAGRPKLESRFIMDVNVLDGTIMAPCTPFTKIWRMRNNGTLDWSKGTQLLWIGGDKFSHAFSVEIETSAGCIPVDKEVDIAVDFIAPELPGRYISYWRMAAPSGQKFGQRVWVLIQVDASLSSTLSASLQDLNLNLPPPSSMANGSKTIDINAEPCENNSFPRANPVKPADGLPKNENEMYFPIDDTLLVGQSCPSPAVPTAPTAPAAAPAAPPASSLALSTILGDQKLSVPTAPESSSAVSYGDKKFPVSTSGLPLQMYPIIDVSIPAPVIVTPPSEDSITKKEREESLLKELEEMGFKQVDLNKEVLRINEYDLEQSVDDLCGVSEWDTILEELEEMGFCDKVMNKKLLLKNNGSIKHVVMDLISGEKA